VAVGDFLHNGKLDLAVVNPGSNTVSVLLGNGDGTFQGRVDLPVGALPLSVAAVDLGNGQVDLVVANHDSSNVSVLVGNGDGTFQPARNIDVTIHAFGLDSHPLTLRVGDFNGDGKPDLLISQFVGFDAGESFVTVLPGNGDGTFQAPISQDTGFGLIGLAVGDFNGDGKLDFATAGSPVSGVLVFSGNGDGTFVSSGVFPSGGANPFGVATGDFNGDGRPDLVVVNTFSNTVGVLLNTSTPAATATVLAVDVNPAIVGQTETLTATVTSPAGTPSGTVTFFDGTTVLGTAPLDANGQTSLAVSLGAGTHPLMASFSGTGAFAASTSAVLTETVTSLNTPPSLAPLADQIVPSSQQVLTVSLAATDPDGDVLTFAATGQSLAFVLNQQAGGLTYHPEFNNFFGAGEKWLLAADGATWYFIKSDGTLSRWDGSSAASGTLLGNVGTSYYTDPNLIPAAPADDPRATLSISGDTLTISRDPSFVSGMVITVTVNDGHGHTDSQTFRVTVA
jgi:hypothetical protein